MQSLTICIPSYNRPKQLKRLLNSIRLSSLIKIDVLIIDDCSPKQMEISKCVLEANHLKNAITYFPLKKNVGFDENALNLINKATGDFLLFVTDDDIVNSEYIEKTIFLLTKLNAKVGVTAYKTSECKKINRVYKSTYVPKLKKQKDFVKCIYNCILLSGIIVSRESIKKLEDRLYREKEGKKSLEELAEKKPKMVEKIFNDEMKRLKRCIELFTGSKRGEDEKINCTDIFGKSAD